ncbi:hypothetical protein HOY80DRAFT_913339 [Tuber brumale]|nr:hypothetical protein HOY80DRAFT_913339 [Tuber brumale]
MSATFTQQVGGSSTPTIPATSEPQKPTIGQLDIDYFRTEGLEDAEHLEYRNKNSFIGAIDSRAAELSSGNADESRCPYLIFSPVTQAQLAIIETIRDKSYKRLRFMYLNDPKALIIKVMPSGVHEFATEAFVSALADKVGRMGLRRALPSVGRTTYQGTSSRKEADGGFKPRAARPHETDWPTVILESGVAESPARLNVDGRWWLANSKGQVKIALLFFVSKAAKTIHIEHWELETSGNLRLTRANPDPMAARPIIKASIHINANRVTGGRLVLQFEKMFLRAPNIFEGETNLIFTIQDLRDYYDDVWTAAL